MPTQVYRTDVQLLQCYAEDEDDEDDEENDDDDINFTFHLNHGAITITQKTYDNSELGPAQQRVDRKHLLQHEVLTKRPSL
jgi:hypothetical protein